jgi:hypothetical protein
VASKAEVQAFAASLKGRRTGVRYADLAKLLLACDCTVKGSGGSHRSWKHPNVPDILTLRDGGSGEVIVGYISSTRRFLEAIASTL